MLLLMPALLIYNERKSTMYTNLQSLFSAPTFESIGIHLLPANVAVDEKLNEWQASAVTAWRLAADLSSASAAAVSPLTKKKAYKNRG